jgi:hypothetical protein
VSAMYRACYCSSILGILLNDGLIHRMFVSERMINVIGIVVNRINHMRGKHMRGKCG